MYSFPYNPNPTLLQVELKIHGSKVLGLGWEEVHDIAEQLEHVNSSRFYERIDELLNRPKFDPHGEPIPYNNGKIHAQKGILQTDQPLPSPLLPKMKNYSSIT